MKRIQHFVGTGIEWEERRPLRAFIDKVVEINFICQPTSIFAKTQIFSLS